MTEFEIITSVMELVTSTEGVTNTSLSQEQVADELDTLRVRLIGEQDKLTLFRRPYQAYTQEIPSLKILKTDSKVSYVEIPKLVIKATGEPAYLYIGGKYDGSKDTLPSPYRLVTGDITNALHDHFIGGLPIVHYDEGRLTFLNVAPSYIKVIGVFEDPSDLELGGYYDPEKDEYPMPAGMIDILIGKTAESYIRTMYRVRVQPNVQTDSPDARPQSK